MHKRLLSFEPNTFTEIPLDSWLQPESCQQSGYDAIYLESSGIIRFIQTTIAHSHDLKMNALSLLVIRLRQLNYRVNEAEIFFVIPDSTSVLHFAIGKLFHWEEFANLFDSWPKESAEKV